MRTLIILLLFGYLANAQDGYLVSYMQGNNNSSSTSDPTPSNTNPELDPVNSAHRFGDLEANALVAESTYNSLTNATETIIETSTNYGQYAVELEATATGECVKYHRFEGATTGLEYTVFIEYRMIVGSDGRISGGGANYTGLSSTSWTTLTYDVTSSDNRVDVYIFPSYYGSIGDKMQYKIQVKLKAS